MKFQRNRQAASLSISYGSKKIIKKWSQQVLALDRFDPENCL